MADSDSKALIMSLEQTVAELQVRLDNKDHDHKMSSIGLLTGRSTLHLAHDMSKDLSIGLIECSNKTFANGEIKVEIQSSIRNKNMFIIQTGITDKDHSINDYIMELFLMVHACKLSGAKTISVIIPCYPYARADKKNDSRCSVGSAMIAGILENLGVKRITSMDLHAGQIQGFARNIPFDNLYGINLLSAELKSRYFKNMSIEEINDKFVLVSPDGGGIKRVEAYARMLKMDYVIMHKQRDYTKENVVLNSKLIGDPQKIKGKTGIVIDDIIDTMGTMMATIGELSKYLDKLIIVATHGILSGPAVDHINKSNNIISVIVINTVDQTENMKRCEKLISVNAAPLFAETIRRLQLNKSISELFPTH
jgi:ribose-phosphate pyrophosphokinase